MKLKNNIAVSESGFMFDPSSGESFSLNGTGREILKLLTEGNSTDQMRETILAKYDVTEMVFNRYLEDFTQMLYHFNLLENEG